MHPPSARQSAQAKSPLWRAPFVILWITVHVFGATLRHTLDERIPVNEAFARVQSSAQLPNLGVDLRTLMQRRETPGVFVREQLAKRVVGLLQSGNNVLLRGRSGCGKTALARSLVAVHWASARPETGQLQLVETRSMNAPLIIETSVARIIQGCHYVHDLENKLETAFETVRQKPAILFIDNVDECIGAGSSSADPAADVANMLVPHLDRGMRLIGCTTMDGEARLRDKNPRLFSRFTVVDVPDPDAEESVDVARICLFDIQRTDSHHLTRAAVARGMELSAHFFPGEAPLAAYLRLARSAHALEGSLSSEALRRAAALELGIDERFIGVGPPIQHGAMVARLGAEVFGQPEALCEVADALSRYSAGLFEAGQPVAAFLFAGPSGVGKTSLALAASELFTGSRDAVLRFDMSEYADPFAVTRLIEDSPNSLVGRLQSRRAGVLLLDEVEKAHPTVIRLLLQALGEARLTSESGRTVRLDHYLVAMTTNVGGRRWSFGLAHAKTVALVLSDVSEEFPNEFRARLTRTLVFSPLDASVAARVVARELDRLNQLPGLVRRGLQLVWADTLIPALSVLGVSRQRGARGVQGVVRSAVATPLGRWLLEHGEAQDGVVMLAPHSERGELVSLSIDWVDESGFYRELAN